MKLDPREVIALTSEDPMGSAFMVPEYWEGVFIMVDTRNGTFYIPEYMVATDPKTREPYSGRTLREDLKTYVPGPIHYVETVEGVGVRLSAPGYLDCTEWTVFDTETEARSYIRDTFDVCPDTGQPLEY